MSIDHSFITTYQPRTAGSMPVYGQKPVNPNGIKDFKGLIIEQKAALQAPAAGHTAKEYPARTASHAPNTEKFSSGTAPYLLSLTPSQPYGEAVHTEAAEEDGFDFWDLIDIVNPLQHIPIVSMIYRSITGDEIEAPARVLGGAVFGGPVGAAVGLADAVFEEATGKDVGETIMSAFISDDAPQQLAASSVKMSDITWHKEMGDQPVQVASLHKDFAGLNKSFSSLEEAPTPTLPTHPSVMSLKTPTTPTHMMSVDSPTGTEHRSWRPGEEVSALASEKQEFPNKQKARAQGGESVLPPELIAQEMREAWELYGEMKANGLAPQ